MNSLVARAKSGLAIAKANIPPIPGVGSFTSADNGGVLRRLEDLEVALHTAHTVNRHLNSEVEKLTTELGQLRREKEAYERNVAELSALLRTERRRSARLSRTELDLTAGSDPALLLPAPGMERRQSAAKPGTPPAPAADGVAAAETVEEGEMQQHPGTSSAGAASGVAEAVPVDSAPAAALTEATVGVTEAAASPDRALGMAEAAEMAPAEAAVPTPPWENGIEPAGASLTAGEMDDTVAVRLADAAVHDGHDIAAEAALGSFADGESDGWVHFGVEGDGPTGQEEWAQDERWDALRRVGEAAGWLVDPKEVSMGPKIGEGAFGVTYRSIWRGVTVAVKVVRVDSASTSETFLREVEVMTSLRHPNLLPFYGACLMPAKHCWLVTEYMPGGNLAQWLYGGPNRVGTVLMPSRPLVERLSMALDVARGMEALEGSHPYPVVHRDLKPSNVFVDGRGRARVADFGLARRLTPGCAAELTGETGTYFYMSPEMMRHEVYDSKTDIFSWGIMLIELINQRPPYDGMYLTPVQIALGVADGKLDPSEMLSPNSNSTVAALAAMCVDPQPEMRPPFSMVAAELELVIEEVKAAAAAAAGGNGVLGRMFRR